jgi:hypothetical protein
VARLGAHGEEKCRIRKVSPTGLSSITLSLRSDGVVLKKLKNGTYDSGWKIHSRQTPPDLVENLKAKGWEVVV